MNDIVEQTLLNDCKRCIISCYGNIHISNLDVQRFVLIYLCKRIYLRGPMFCDRKTIFFIVIVVDFDRFIC